MALSVTYQMIKDAAKAAKDEAERLENQPMLQCVLSLSSLAVEAVAENMDLRLKVQELTEQLNKRATMTFRDKVYWSDDPRDPGPFCPTCWKKDNKAIPIREDIHLHAMYCSSCETVI